MTSQYTIISYFIITQNLTEATRASTEREDGTAVNMADAGTLSLR